MITVLSRWVPGTRCAATILALVLAHQSAATEGVISSSGTDVLRWVAVSVAVAVIVMGWVLDRSLESTTNRLDRTHRRLITQEAAMQREVELLRAEADYWRAAAEGRTHRLDETTVQRPEGRLRTGIIGPFPGPDPRGRR